MAADHDKMTKKLADDKATKRQLEGLRFLYQLGYPTDRPLPYDLVEDITSADQGKFTAAVKKAEEHKRQYPAITTPSGSFTEEQILDAQFTALKVFQSFEVTDLNHPFIKVFLNKIYKYVLMSRYKTDLPSDELKKYGDAYEQSILCIKQPLVEKFIKQQQANQEKKHQTSAEIHPIPSAKKITSSTTTTQTSTNTNATSSMNTFFKEGGKIQPHNSDSSEECIIS